MESRAWHRFEIENHPSDIFKPGAYEWRIQMHPSESPSFFRPASPDEIIRDAMSGAILSFRRIGGKLLHPSLESFYADPHGRRVRETVGKIEQIKKEHPVTVIRCDTGVSSSETPTHEQRMNLWWETDYGWIRVVAQSFKGYFIPKTGKDGFRWVNSSWFKNRRFATCPPEVAE